MTHFGAPTPTTLCPIRAQISHCIHLYTNCSTGWVLGEQGRRGNQFQVERVATSLGKANVVSGVGQLSHQLRSTIVLRMTYRDCAWDDSCVLCSRCFHSTNHTGHNVSFFIAQQSGGCCDCGDAEAWRVPIGCPHHPPAESSSETPKVVARNIPDMSNPQPKSDQAIPSDLQETMKKTVAYALDFILDTLDYSPDEPSVPTGEADLRLQPSADPMMKDQFCVVLWNDEKHSFDDVIKLLMETTNRTREEANDAAVRIDEQGRDIIDMHANATRLLETARTFSQIDLGVTVRRAYDTFREQISVVIIEWILDLTRSRLITDTYIMREVIANQLLAPRKPSTLNPNPESQKALAEVDSPVRLDYMFLYHTRLWKRPRLNLKEVYASIQSLSHEHKLAVGE